MFLTKNVTALDLCAKYGCPLYVYDTAIIETKYKRMAASFDVADLQINYACKALNNINILKFIKHIGAGLDAVSIQEVWLGLKAGFAPNKIMFTPNCVSFQEIELAVKEGVKINIDNISLLEQFGNKYTHYPIGIRINPHIWAGGSSKISVGHIDSKFGISIHQMPLVKRIVDTLGISIEGLHMHTGSDILDSEVFLQAAEILFSAAQYFENLRYIDFGSGFKVPYKEDDIETNIENLGVKLSQRFNDFCKSYGKNLSLIFEPGKFLVSQAGFFFAKVNVVKQTISTIFAGLDAGMNHLIRPMFYDAYHHIENISRPYAATRIYTIVGYICETDTFGINRKISEIQEGDILMFRNAGAYCFTMSSNYNSRLRPAEVMLYQGKDFLIRRQETFEDLLTTQLDVLDV